MKTKGLTFAEAVRAINAGNDVCMVKDSLGDVYFDIVEEEKSETKECNHVKVYANEILLSNPPQYRWICSECGFEGIDTGTICVSSSYEDIKKKFEEKPFVLADCDRAEDKAFWEKDVRRCYDELLTKLENALNKLTLQDTAILGRKQGLKFAKEMIKETFGFEKEKCNHEPQLVEDRVPITEHDDGQNIKFKCKKCGEWY